MRAVRSAGWGVGGWPADACCRRPACSYKELDLIYFFTAGEKEVRLGCVCWCGVAGGGGVLAARSGQLGNQDDQLQRTPSLPPGGEQLGSCSCWQARLMAPSCTAVAQVRCWTILRGTMAPQAAGVIHTDFERGFIKAEVVAYDDFRRCAAGWMDEWL